jgi:Ca2+-binding RTX toxin-like protein
VVGDDTLAGQGGNDTLIGDDGNDYLNGGTGIDDMTGGLGDDTYIVDNTGDVVTEVAGGGIDWVYSSIGYSLGANVEHLRLTGTAAIDGTGNAVANRMLGNSASNLLVGLGGNDIINGGSGADTMVGGTGNDRYSVSDAADLVSESAGAGIDQVFATVSYTLATNVEHLTLTGSGSINATGNGVANKLTGNSATNTLGGLGGNDVIAGGGGDDHLLGGSGNDRLIGGAGVDNFYFDTAPNANTNFDKIVDFTPTDDTIQLDLAVFTGIAGPGTLAAGAFRLGTAAADADDRIIYDSATGKIFYDADGNAAGAQVLFAQVTAGTALTNVDFVAFA